MNITYESIEHLVAKTTINNDTLTCEFEDPQHPGKIESTINISSIIGVKSKMKTSLIREIKNTAASLLGNLLRQVLGQSAGSSFSRVTDEGLRTNFYQVNLVNTDKRKAVVIAFEKVSSQFRLDEVSQKFYRIK